jgi:ethanolamine ammonia-lyase small subunit
MKRADPWAALAGLTAARIALGRAGASLPTEAVLRFDVAHALARDAVHTPLDLAALAERWQAQQGEAAVIVHSLAGDRHSYLQRPDLGRRLGADSAARLATLATAETDLAIVVADGLSATGVAAHALDLLDELLPRLAGLSRAPLVLAGQGRVALGDEIGLRLKARLVLVLLGERPGLSSPDSLGAYLTFAPRDGRRDAERNCVSNIRPAGLPLPLAAARLAWLIDAALTRRLTGVGLKDESDALGVGGNQTSVRPEPFDPAQDRLVEGLCA